MPTTSSLRVPSEASRISAGRMPTLPQCSLREWLFALIVETCHDRDCLYRAFVERVCGLLTGIYRAGATTQLGTCHLPGIKAVTSPIHEAASPAGTAEQRTTCFDLATGRSLPG